MVTQPAYLSELKAYAKSRARNAKDIADSVADLSNESDRGAIILAATSIEDMLEYQILLKLPGLRDDEPTRKRMFEADGQIASFSRKIEMAYALGIIDKAYRKKIDLIREIRNACAHSRKPISMKNAQLLAACRVVVTEMLPALKDQNPETLRAAFVSKCMYVSYYVMTGEKLETPESHVAHFERLKREMAAGL
jgi:hypothetical protein